MPLGAFRLNSLARYVVAAGRTAKTITANGNAQVDTAQSKFSGASALFDGTGDYLYVADNMQIAGSGDDFTIEFWIRWNSTSGLQAITSDRPPTSAGYVATNFYLEKTGGDGFNMGYSGGGDIITSGSLVTTGSWYHMAVVRASGSTKLYLDGTQQGGALSYTGAVGDGTLNIGANVGYYHNGWIDEFRISNTARYTTSFTPPTAPFVNDSDTILLIHADGTDGSTVFEDDNGTGRARVGVSALGDAQIDTAQSKFGGSSLLLDGTGDYLTFHNNQINISTGDFTVEGWFRINSISASQVIATIGTTTNFNNSIRILLESDGDIQMNAYSTTGSLFTLTTTNQPVSTGTWYHFAVVRNGNDFDLYLDGTTVLNTTSSSTLYNGGLNFIGTRLASGGTPGLYFNGHIDEFRISNTARYTANFTPSTTAFQNDSNTVLLIHADGTDGSTYFPDDNS